MEEIGGEVPERTSEQVSIILAHAKLKEEDFLPTTQVLYLNDKNAKIDQYRILELDNNLLEVLKNGEKLVFKGESKENIVLCTDTKTYNVKECQTSNSLLMVPNLQLKTELKSTPTKNITKKYVEGINHKYLEVTASKPHLGKVLQLLESTVYKGPEREFEYDDSTLFNFEELLKIAQASKKELEAFLVEINVITIAGKIRILELDYHFRVLSFLLKSIEENSWTFDEPLSKMQKEESINAWSELVPKEILEKLFDLYTDKIIVDNELCYKYNELKVCQFFAKVLLQYAGKFNLNDFLQAWKESVPEGMEVKEEMLAGIAIIDRISQPAVIWDFPESKLPDKIAERFKVLFKAKAKWSVSEITPYIQSLTTEKMDANAMLAKFARACHVNGVRHYCAKHNN